MINVSTADSTDRVLISLSLKKPTLLIIGINSKSMGSIFI